MKKDDIKHLYGEARGIYGSLNPQDSEYYYHHSTIEHFNAVVDEASQVLERNLDRYKVGQDSIYMAGNQRNYEKQPVRSKVGALVTMLEEEFELANSTSSPVVVVNQNQEQSQDITVSVITVQELIDATADSDTKELLKQLETALESRDEKESKSLLSKLSEKSWEIFLRVLPFVLEKWA